MNVQTKYNVLNEQLFSVDVNDGGCAEMSLPEVLHGLGTGRVAVFRALRPHQQHAWHAFLVQLAAMALHRGGEKSPEQSAGHWRELLLAMTDGDETPWCLVVDDLSKPAFMQPPVPEGKLGKWTFHMSPASLDTLMVAKNHDVKRTGLHYAKPEHWIMALINVQTTDSYFLKHNGIIRMKGRTASRPFVSIALSPKWSTRFYHDTEKLLINRSSIFELGISFQQENGVSLVWLSPWDGESQLQLEMLDPYFVEICQRIRLKEINGLVGYVGTSKKERIAGVGLKGVTGDPWAPISRGDDVSCLNVRKRGFDYKLCSDLINSGNYKLGLSCTYNKSDGGLYFIAASSARDGKDRRSEGYHLRTIYIPARYSAILKSEARDKLAGLSKKRIELCDEVRRKVLHHALCVITQGATDGKLDFRDKSDNAWLESFERDVDAIFFERMFAQIDLDDEEAERKWIGELLDLAEKQLDDALRSMPQPSIRRYRIESKARGLFHGTARKIFTDFFQQGGSL